MCMLPEIRCQHCSLPIRHDAAVSGDKTGSYHPACFQAAGRGSSFQLEWPMSSVDGPVRVVNGGKHLWKHPWAVSGL